MEKIRQDLVKNSKKYVDLHQIRDKLTFETPKTKHYGQLFYFQCP